MLPLLRSHSPKIHSILPACCVRGALQKAAKLRPFSVSAPCFPPFLHGALFAALNAATSDPCRLGAQQCVAIFSASSLLW